MAKSYLGLRGTKLNIAVGVIAGLDFFLFGYDQGVMGGLLTLDSFIRTFPQLDTSSDTYKNMSPADQLHQSNVQGEKKSAKNKTFRQSSDSTNLLCRYLGCWLQSGLFHWLYHLYLCR